MELRYDTLYNLAMETEQGRAVIDSVEMVNDENKLALFLKLREYEKSLKVQK
jgi:hypothetical protein